MFQTDPVSNQLNREPRIEIRDWRFRFLSIFWGIFTRDPHLGLQNFELCTRTLNYRGRGRLSAIDLSTDIRSWQIWRSEILYRCQSALLWALIGFHMGGVMAIRESASPFGTRWLAFTSSGLNGQLWTLNEIRTTQVWDIMVGSLVRERARLLETDLIWLKMVELTGWTSQILWPLDTTKCRLGGSTCYPETLWIGPTNVRLSPFLLLAIKYREKWV